MIVPFLLAVDFMNFTYRTNPCQTNVAVPVVMRKGAFSYFDRKMGVGFDLYVDSVKQGSLQPGTRQAVVVIACDFPVGGTAAAYAFDVRKNAAVLLGQVTTADWGPDWGEGPDSIRIRFERNRLLVNGTAYVLRSGKLAKLRQK